ncbi:hypothetical protein CONPUDRAFT_158970 [Coniophora puteana RWD-64-598 SS2]|uniref:Uncharacterized protein n=1 Tax=Coniophora puteana (strain RWD-64-598) TaxID=741705 RepID=A0A5M3MA49_CONPW|nr:uncharacterized protein CONPUDRAFT_158970 [Coniophora puteana RWD-64-598 SS2]EIW75515.1 hypothetical protein CONPUDRAFT_158970 [Coniophora puteana RWD-64-598 SS2]
MPRFYLPDAIPLEFVDTDQVDTVQNFLYLLDNRWKQMLMHARMDGINTVVFGELWNRERASLDEVLHYLLKPLFPDVIWPPYVVTILHQRSAIFVPGFVDDPNVFGFAMHPVPVVRNIGADWWKNVPYSATTDVPMSGPGEDRGDVPESASAATNADVRSSTRNRPADVVIGGDEDTPTAKPAKQKKPATQESDAEGDIDGPSARKKAKAMDKGKKAVKEKDVTPAKEAPAGKEGVKGKDGSKTKAGSKAAGGKKGKETAPPPEDDADEGDATEAVEDPAASKKKAVKLKGGKKPKPPVDESSDAGKKGKHTVLPVEGQNTWTPPADASGASASIGGQELNVGAFLKPFPPGTPTLPHMLVARRSFVPSDLLFDDMEIGSEVEMREYLERQKVWARNIVKNSVTVNTRFEGRLAAQDHRIDQFITRTDARIAGMAKDIGAIAKAQKSIEASLKKLAKQSGESASGQRASSNVSKDFSSENKDPNQSRMSIMRPEPGAPKQWTLTPPGEPKALSSDVAQDAPSQSFQQIGDDADADENPVDAESPRSSPPPAAEPAEEDE